MRPYCYFLTLLIISFFNQTVAIGQQMPIDFSDSADNFATFGGTSFSIITDPINSGNDVGRFVNSGASWEGSYLDLTQPIDLAFRNTFTLSFYSADSDTHNVVLKLEQGTGPDVQLLKVITSPSQFNWVTLTFDFGLEAGIGSGLYNRLTIFVDGGNTTSGTYLIDDIAYGSTWTDPNTSDPNAPDPVYDYLVWSDEFDIPGDINNANWHRQTQVIIPGVGWANNEEQHYTNRIDNSFVDNSGALNIVAKRETFNSQGITKNYTSARLNSKFAFTYGRVDVRAKLPAWDGTWPAIWTLGKNINEPGAYWSNQGFGTTPWPNCGEIDIMEHGLHAINETSSAIHTPSSSGNTINTKKQIISDVAVNWHIYTLNWSPNQITFLVDGVGYYTYNPAVKDASTWPFNLDQFILLNLAMGGISGSIDPNVSSDTILVDYVRVYQTNPLSIAENILNDIKVYPNPAKNSINVSSNEKIDFLELYSILGKLILTEDKTTNKLDVSGLNTGVYLLTIYSEKNRVVKKVIIN